MTASAIPCDARQAAIGGVWRSAANGDRLALENPFDGTPLARIARGTAANIDVAVAGVCSAASAAQARRRSLPDGADVRSHRGRGRSAGGRVAGGSGLGEEAGAALSAYAGTRHISSTGLHNAGQTRPAALRMRVEWPCSRRCERAWPSATAPCASDRRRPTATWPR